MMKYIILLITVFFLSCSDKSNHIKIVKNIQSDSSYVVSLYKDEVHISDTLYDKNNNLKQIVTFYQEKKYSGRKNVTDYCISCEDTVLSTYTREGSLEAVTHNLGPRMPIETKVYYNNGNIKEYNFRYKDENLYYSRSYQMNGSLMKETGRPFFVAYTKPNKEFLSEKDTLEALFIAPIPPDCSTSMFALLSEKEESILQVENSPLFKAWIYPLSKGSWEWEVVMEIKEKSSGKVYKSNIKKMRYEVK